MSAGRIQPTGVLIQLLVLATMHDGAYQRPQPPAPMAQVLGFCAPLPHQRAEFFRHSEGPSEGWRLNGMEAQRGGAYPNLRAVAYSPRRRVHGSSCVQRASIRRAEERAGSSASCSQQVFRKNLSWERDSIARVAYDPAHIPDCNVHATVGKHFLFHEPIPYAKNGQGYLRVTKSLLWWQQREFPGVWTSEGLTTCVEKEYKWSVNSPTWNHIQAMWQGPPLDLLRSVAACFNTVLVLSLLMHLTPQAISRAASAQRAPICPPADGAFSLVPGPNCE
jgi:hypothetical protein